VKESVSLKRSTAAIPAAVAAVESLVSDLIREE